VQVIVPYLFALEKHKSAHENRYSWKTPDSRKVICLVTCPGTKSQADAPACKANGRRYFAGGPDPDRRLRPNPGDQELATRIWWHV